MASPTGIYIGQPVQWLLDHRTAVLAAIRDYATGRVASISGASKSLSRQHASLDDLRLELAEVQLALFRLDPVAYPQPPARRMMRASFSTAE